VKGGSGEEVKKNKRNKEWEKVRKGERLAGWGSMA
jgi:hypothetical protein